MTVTFIGHSDAILSDKIKKDIRAFLASIVISEESTEFLCGGMGNFDSFAASVCGELKTIYNGISVAYVTPYITIDQQKKTDELLKSGVYDEAIYPPIEDTPLRFAISKRNEWMIENSDLVIAFVNRSYGGAYKSLGYAIRGGKKIINFAEADKQ